jgi:hypothetical protein
MTNDPEYISTIAKFEEFLESPVWTDILTELKEWKNAIESEYGICKDLHTLGTIQGRLQACIYLEQLPIAILGFLREKAEQEALERELVDAGRQPLQ